MRISSLGLASSVFSPKDRNRQDHYWYRESRLFCFENTICFNVFDKGLDILDDPGKMVFSFHYQPELLVGEINSWLQHGAFCLGLGICCV